MESAKLQKELHCRSMFIYAVKHVKWLQYSQILTLV